MASSDDPLPPDRDVVVLCIGTTTGEITTANNCSFACASVIGDDHRLSAVALALDVDDDQPDQCLTDSLPRRLIEADVELSPRVGQE